MVLEYIKTAWEVYKENAMSFILAELIVLVVTGIIVFIGFEIIIGSIGISTLMEMISSRIVLSRLMSIFPLLTGIGTALIFFIIAGLVWIFLKTGIYGMAAQALRGETKVETMFKTARSKGLNGILACLVVGVISLFMFFLLVISLGFVFLLSGVIVGMIMFCLIMILFSLIFPGIILDNLNSLESIKVSVDIVKRNYIDMLCLIFIYLIISIVISLIPFIGALIINLVISPMLFISLTLFYKKRKYQKNKMSLLENVFFQPKIDYDYYWYYYTWV